MTGLALLWSIGTAWAASVLYDASCEDNLRGLPVAFVSLCVAVIAWPYVAYCEARR